MKQSMLFYALIHEENNKKTGKALKMKGPFIHLLPLELVGHDETRRPIIDKDKIIDEQKYLGKKNASYIPLFYEVEVPGGVLGTNKDEEFRKDAYDKAEKHFETKFERMQENYHICSKKR